MRYKVFKGILIFWCLFIGIGALLGGAAMLIKPDGSILQMNSMLPYFKVLPFSQYLFTNFIFAGISLIIVNGISNITAAILMLKNKPIGIKLGTIFGITLMLWICIQFVIFPANIMSTLYFFFGLAQAVCGYAAWVFYCQQSFAENNIKYAAQNKGGGNLVVYFSRMGYTQRLALELAQSTNADVYQIVSAERTSDTLGFWWCGRYGMHKWQMPIKKTNIDLSTYDTVTICTPVWVFALAAPVRTFCNSASGKIKKVNYIINHFNICKYKGVAKEMDGLLKIKHSKATSVCTMLGKVIYKKEI